MATRTITGPLLTPDGAAWPNAMLTFQLRDPLAQAGATVGPSPLAVMTDASGDFSLTLAVPASGAAWYTLTLPSSVRVMFQVAAGSATTLHALLAETQTLPSPSALATHIAAADPHPQYTSQDELDAALLSYLLTSSFTWTNLSGKPSAFAPSAHAASHAAAGSDPLTLAQSQVANLTSDLAGKASTAALAAHEADTTNIHGIADVSALVLTGDSRLTNARTPTAHASSHQDGSADELALDASQLTSGTLAAGRLPADAAFAGHVDVGHDKETIDFYWRAILGVYEVLDDADLGYWLDPSYDAYYVNAATIYTKLELPAGFNPHEGVYAYGLNFSLRTTPDNAVAATYLYGQFNVISNEGPTDGTVDSIAGIYESVSNSAGTATAITGIDLYVSTYDAAIHTDQLIAVSAAVDPQVGTVDAAYAFLAANRLSAAATPAVAYAFYAGRQKGAAAWSFYAEGDPAHFGSYQELVEISDPGAAAVNTARLFARDNGSGKTQVCVRFPSGAVQVLATEP